MKVSCSSSHFKEKLRQYNKRERCLNSMGRVSPCLLCSLVATTIFIFFLLSSPNPINSITKPDIHDQKLASTNQQNDPFHPQTDTTLKINDTIQVVDKCDLFDGHWIPDLNGSRYTNSSCATIPHSKNCFKHGRGDIDFLNWRWKPHQCNLQRFDAKVFFTIVRGKRMSFIGDSVARNHMESLLCLLSQEETPIDIYKDSENRNRIWYFAKHNFTLTTLWTKFFVNGKERVINGSRSAIYDLYLDKVEDNWVRDLPSIDYAVISGAHWLFRPLYLHKGGNTIGCVYCDEPNITRVDVSFAVRLTLRAALNHIDRCKICKKMVTLVRTFSPSHFENGTWNTGGTCNRTSPFAEKNADLNGWEVGMRNVQVEEVERVRKRGNWSGKRFGVLDVTRAMLMRPDGHPGAFSGNKWMRGYNDCVHWCLPGPIDVWNDFLIAVLGQEAWKTS
ncbi:PC-Esterase domain-containing protein/PMR5N domain-containing protein [Cephalotus follicularis]|uniref:PC-Esterase domain-containing protein/PMR5N domain-containing protein n=1 Tax=Cephalotus follicularis TaxID=3775 RepID=A0A1Q3BXH6_CEPFO|nr:PC-Esterase domain-containing protein/PMR5N domain-containing protein [Cephalotus follicularis]